MAHIMALTAFQKMHGLGNDFVILDARIAPVAMTAEAARAISDRHSGIGCDQLILLGASDKADLSMRIFNPDGSEAEACGNATRCVVMREARDCSIETPAGIIEGKLNDGAVSVNMGQPAFLWSEIPLDHAVDTDPLPVTWGPLTDGICVNVGNPHVIFFVDDLTAIDAAVLGPEIEHDPLFPQRVNVNFAHVAADGIDLVVWERGAGLTRACGTGACATAVAAIRRKYVTGPVDVRLPGGTLTIAWQAGSGIIMSGPATHSFSGTVDIDALAGGL